MKRWITHSGVEITQVFGGRSNVFLAGRAGRQVLVDTSVGMAGPLLERRLTSLGIVPGGLAALVLTHAHFDHAANAARLQARFRAPVYVQRGEADFLRRGANPLPRGTVFAARLLADWLFAPLKDRFRYPPCEPDQVVDDCFDLAWLGFPAVILPTPGHSPGSQSLILDNEIALVGDALFGVFPGSVWPPFGEDVAQMTASWKKLLDTGCTLFLPSHGRADSRALVEREYKKHDVYPNS